MEIAIVKYFIIIASTQKLITGSNLKVFHLSS